MVATAASFLREGPGAPGGREVAPGISRCQRAWTSVHTAAIATSEEEEEKEAHHGLVNFFDLIKRLLTRMLKKLLK